MFVGRFNAKTMLQFLARLRAYSALLRWLFTDSLVRFSHDAVRLTAFGIASISAQLVTILILHRYVSALEQDFALAVGHISVQARSPVTLVLIGFIVLFLLLLSAVLTYRSQRGALQLWEHYEAFCGKRAISLVTLATWETAARNSWMGGNNARMNNILQKDPRYSGIVLRMLALSIIPALQVIVYLGMMLYLDVRATLIIIAINACALSFLYSQSREAARSSHLIEKQAKESAKLRHALQQVAMTSPAALAVNDDRLSAVFERGEHKRFMDLILGRVEILRRTQMTAQMTAGFSIAFVIVLMGGVAVGTGYGWGDIIVYLLVLRGTSTGLSTVARTATAVNRFYPQLRRHFEFVRQADPNGVNQAAISSRLHRLEYLGRASEPLQVKNDDRIALIKPGPTSRLVFTYLWAVMARNAPAAPRRADSYLATMRSSPGGVPLRVFLAIRPEFNAQSLRAILKDIDAEPEAAISDTILDVPDGGSEWQRLSDRGRASLLVAAAVLSGAGVIAFDASVLTHLPRQSVHELLRKLESRLVMIVYDSLPESLPRYDERLCIIGDDRGPVAYLYTHEYQCMRDQVSRVYRKIATRFAKSRPTQPIEEELDLEE